MKQDAQLSLGWQNVPIIS